MKNICVPRAACVRVWERERDVDVDREIACGLVCQVRAWPPLPPLVELVPLGLCEPLSLPWWSLFPRGEACLTTFPVDLLSILPWLLCLLPRPNTEGRGRYWKGGLAIMPANTSQHLKVGGGRGRGGGGMEGKKMPCTC